MTWNTQDTNVSWYISTANVDHTISGQWTAISILDHLVTTPRAYLYLFISADAWWLWSTARANEQGLNNVFQEVSGKSAGDAQISCGEYQSISFDVLLDSVFQVKCPSFPYTWALWEQMECQSCSHKPGLTHLSLVCSPRPSGTVCALSIANTTCTRWSIASLFIFFFTFHVFHVFIKWL